MPDREKVINGLEHELQNRGKCGHYCREEKETISCEYDKDGLCIQHWGNDALALLKAQKPRIVTEADFKNADEAGYIPAWCEEKDTADVYCECISIGALEDAKFGHMRWWTYRPTDEQREATPWPD